MEWFSVGWATATNTNYLRLVPRTLNGVTPVSVPERVDLYYKQNGSWLFLQAATLPANISAAGHTIRFATVKTNEIKVEGTFFRTDGQDFFFQLAGVKVGWRDESVTKQIKLNNFTCSVYGDTATMVLENDDNNMSYDMNVTKLGATSYVAVFHANSYDKETGCYGDSIGARYASSPDGNFGYRQGDCPTCPGDHVLTRTENFSSFAGSPACTGLYSVSGAGNAILLKRKFPQPIPGAPEWTLFSLTVSDYNEATKTRDYNWHHFLMVAHPTAVSNMFHSSWYSLANNGTSDYWQEFPSGPPVYANYQPWPARVVSTGKLLSSQHSVYFAGNSTDPDAFADTNGLIGNMSYDQNLSKIYFFYNDYNGKQLVTQRREAYDTTYVNWWKDPPSTPIKTNSWLKPAFHATKNRWAVFSFCEDKSTKPAKLDVCLQFTPSNAVDEISTLAAPTTTANGLGLSEFFWNTLRDGPGPGDQYGFLKNEWGQVPSNEFRVYVGRWNPKPLGPWGMDVYSVKVICN